MSTHCCHEPVTAPDPKYRRVLWIALTVNAFMFLVEITAGLQAQSVALLADAVDFFGDAINYGVFVGRARHVAKLALAGRYRQGAYDGRLWRLRVDQGGMERDHRHRA